MTNKEFVELLKQPVVVCSLMSWVIANGAVVSFTAVMLFESFMVENDLFVVFSKGDINYG